jgi:uncharacterized protein (DUF2249 family)
LSTLKPDPKIAASFQLKNVPSVSIGGMSGMMAGRRGVPLSVSLPFLLLSQHHHQPIVHTYLCAMTHPKCGAARHRAYNSTEKKRSSEITPSRAVTCVRSVRFVSLRDETASENFGMSHKSTRTHVVLVSKEKDKYIMTEISTLDVRNMVPRERHPAIFARLDALKPGGILRLVNDHNPAPLRYQLLAERPDMFNWEPERQGPDEWVIRIQRVESEQ